MANNLTNSVTRPAHQVPMSFIGELAGSPRNLTFTEFSLRTQFLASFLSLEVDTKIIAFSVI